MTHSKEASLDPIVTELGVTWRSMSGRVTIGVEGDTVCIRVDGKLVAGAREAEAANAAAGFSRAAALVAGMASKQDHAAAAQALVGIKARRSA